ncbi:MAG: VanZ family protein [Chloroflexi bacterium]|nr:VanZ family protein [Chloroflexota bacterium]
MKQHLFVLLWIVGILFPMAWFTSFSPTAQSIFNTVFSSGWVHILMHAFLYAVLATLLVYGWYHKQNSLLHWRRVGFLLAVILAVALLQENIQLLSEQRSLGADEIFDIGVDLLGGALGIFFSVRFVNKTSTS